MKSTGIKTVSLIDKNRNIIFNGKLTSLPLKEVYVINKCIELFNDNEPCIIHRTFAMKKIFLELEDYFKVALSQGKTEIEKEQITNDIISLLDIQDDIYKIVIA